jgi:hypothetical protein
MYTGHPIEDAQSHLRWLDNQPVETFKCECCDQNYESGEIGLCQEENVYFSNECVLAGGHIPYFSGGSLTDLQISTIHETFIQV